MRRVKEGTSAVLLQSGLGEKWWADSMECYTYLRNIQDLLSDGKTPYERRFWEPFNGPIIPFGSMIEHHPISAEDESRLHQFGKKVLLDIFLGYVLIECGIWKGDIRSQTLRGLENMDTSEIHAPRLSAKAELTPQMEENFIFLTADGTAKLSLRVHEFREPTLRREQPVGDEDLSGELQGEPEGFQPTETKDDAEHRNDFLVNGRRLHFVVITSNVDSHKSGSVARKTC